MKASKYKMDSEFRMEIDRQIRHAMPEMHYPYIPQKPRSNFLR